MADKLATAFTAVANPADATLMMLADPASGERQRIDIGTFFNRSQGFSFGAAVVLGGGVTGNVVATGNIQGVNGVLSGTLGVSGVISTSATGEQIQLGINVASSASIGFYELAAQQAQIQYNTGSNEFRLNVIEAGGIFAVRIEGVNALAIANNRNATFTGGTIDSPSVASMLVTSGSNSNAGDHLWQKWQRGDGTGNAVELRKSDLVGGAGAAFGTSAATPLIFFTNSVESLRLHSNGDATFSGTTTTFGSDVGGNTSVLVENQNMGDAQSRYFGVSGFASTGAGTTRVAQLGVRKHAGIANPCGYLWLEQQNATNRFTWFDDGGLMRTSATFDNVGTTTGTVVGTQTSDQRVKKIAEGFKYGLDAVIALADKAIEFTFSYDTKNQKHLGFSAQEVQKLIPEAVYNTKDSKTVDGKEYKDILAMDSRELIPVLFKAIAELNKKIENK